MSSFIFEDELEKVVSPLSKEYLKEVLSSYHHGNYRSAVVVLYTVVIFDLIEKLRILKDIYNDSKASDILTEIEDIQRRNPKSSEWERKLVELVCKKTELFDSVEERKMDYLKDIRNISAHPIYNNEYKLINPTKEETRSLIRNCFEIVFQKEPLLTKKILDELISDSKQFQSKVGSQGLGEYLDSKYFSKMNDKVKGEVFKSLWKFVFKINNDDCIMDRKYNYYTLYYLVKGKEELYYNVVNEDSAWYSQIEYQKTRFDSDFHYADEYETSISSLIFFLAQFNRFYRYLDEHAKQIIKGAVKDNIRYLTVSYYASENMKVHLENLKIKHQSITYSSKRPYYECHTCINIIDLIILYENSVKMGDDSYVKDFIIYYFTTSVQFSGASYIWGLVRIYLSKFNEEEMNKLVREINGCRDIYKNNSFKEMFSEISEVYKRKFDKELDVSGYNSIMDSLEDK